MDHDTLALINDNDFGMTDGAGVFDPQGRLVDSSALEDGCLRTTAARDLTSGSLSSDTRA